MESLSSYLPLPYSYGMEKDEESSTVVFMLLLVLVLLVLQPTSDVQVRFTSEVWRPASSSRPLGYSRPRRGTLLLTETL